MRLNARVRLRITTRKQKGVCGSWSFLFHFLLLEILFNLRRTRLFRRSVFDTRLPKNRQWPSSQRCLVKRCPQVVLSLCKPWSGVDVVGGKGVWNGWVRGGLRASGLRQPAPATRRAVGLRRPLDPAPGFAQAWTAKAAVFTWAVHKAKARELKPEARSSWLFCLWRCGRRWACG